LHCICLVFELFLIFALVEIHVYSSIKVTQNHAETNVLCEHKNVTSFLLKLASAACVLQS
jgi:hypothetical protein